MSTTKRIYALIHGYGGGRFVLDYLYRYLLRQQYDVRYVVLDGHETTRREFAKSTSKTWISSAAAALSAYRKECDELIVVGFSMGGLIAANLCKQLKIDKIVFINTPVYYWNAKKISQNILHDIRARNYINLKRYAKTSLDKPFSTLVQFQKLLERSKKLFEGVRCPALVAQCLNDDTVRPKSAEFIYRRLGGIRFIKLYEGGAHQVFDTDVAPWLCHDIDTFANMR